ncbi:MAG: 3-phosphoserine/phosphohydroxythreonine transaminase [Desulfobulbaceae bacterium]|jgi:phosphoserine aminotransferase|nr:3-phosphoserine/phosphohydroxythreonine transaminase [Desulfobulbaceae bacterium]
MPERIYNFSPGPGTLPQEVLTQAAKDIVNFNDKGIGLIELSHRSKEFMAVYAEAEAGVRELLEVPDNFKILFLQGGASTQFAMVPMNLLGKNQKGTYLNTGTWAKKAIKEANIIASAEVAYSAEDSMFNHVPRDSDYTVAADSEYLYFVSNNTIYGTQFKELPKSDKMLISDMSSDIMSRAIDFSKFGLIFAGAQKNMGPAGVTLVIVREDLLDRVADTVPTMLRYKTHAAKDSMFNTPPCFAMYCVGLVCKWLKANGGVAGMAKKNAEKAAILYDMIDSTPFYKGHAQKDSRSLMNVTFNLPTPELEVEFIKQGTERGLDGLKGHRSIGGCRASIYNAFPQQGVLDLVAFMQEFAKANS